MTTTYTSNLQLGEPAHDDAGWDTVLNANSAKLDGLAALGQFAIRAVNIDSSGAATDRVFSVSGGYYLDRTDNVRDFIIAQTSNLAAASGNLTATASGTTCVWLEPDGTFGQGSTYSADGAYAPLGRITCDSTKITSIVDDRHPTFFIGDAPSASYMKVATVFNLLGTGSLTLDSSNVGSPGVTVIASTTAGASSVNHTLPVGSTVHMGTLIIFKKLDATAVNVHIQAQGTDTIDGATSQTITAQNAVLRIIYAGLGRWYVV